MIVLSYKTKHEGASDVASRNKPSHTGQGPMMMPVCNTAADLPPRLQPFTATWHRTAGSMSVAERAFR